MTIEERIGAYVKENNIKQKTLSTKTGISENALSLVFNGKRKLSADEYISICDAVCVAYDKFTVAKAV